MIAAFMSVFPLGQHHASFETPAARAPQDDVLS